MTSLADAFDRAVVPSAPALVYRDRRMSYGELDAAAGRLAARLVALGVGPEVRVAVCVERSIELVVAIVAVIRAGGVYVPLDVALPAERLRFLIEDSRARAIIAQPAAIAALPRAAVPVIDVDAIAGAPVAEYARPALHPDHLAAIFYTSGTTGRPKPVGVTHRAIHGMVCSAEVGLAAEDVVAQIASPAFDAATLEIWGALLHGARLEVIPRDVLLSPRRFAHALRDRAISFLAITPVLFNEVARHDPSAFASVREVLVGGETADPHAMAAVMRHGAPRALYNAYGPTETTTLATTYRIPLDLGGAAVPIGRPIAGLTACVLDDSMGPVADEVEGELYLGGAGLARGYLERPGLTAASFVPDPRGAPGARLYRTGDRAVRSASGELRFAGRRDRQIKLRGFRIELDEIEVVLRGHSGVRDAAVIAHDLPAHGVRIAAYYVPRAPGAASAAELRRHLGAHVPAYMVPAAWCELAALPVGAHGKLDRAGLAAIAPVAAPIDDPPRTELERRLAQLFCELLGLAEVERGDSFLELGGHSLLATRASARLRDELGIEVCPTALLAAPSLAALAGELEALLAAPRGALLPRLAPAAGTGPWPLSFAQERVWVLEQLAPGNLAYNCSFAFYLDGPLDVVALERTLTEIVRRHESLRTTFHARDGVPEQVVHPPFAIELGVEEVGDADLAAWMRARTERAFELARLPLVRWELARLGAERHALLQVEHHFVHDGWSVGVLLREIAALYAAFVAREASPLAPLAVQLRDFAVWERAAAAAVAAEQLAYWKRRLSPAPEPLELGAEYPRPAHQRFVGAALLRDLPLALFERADRVARARGTTPFVVFLAAFYILLQRRSGRADLAVGSVVANRRTRESEPLIGMVLNTVVLRTDLSGPLRVGELLRRVSETCLEAQAHQDVPFHHVTAAVTDSRDLTGLPLFRTMFSFHDAAMPDLRFGGLEGRFEYVHNGSAKADLNVVIAPSAERLQLIWEYNTELWAGATAARLADELVQLIAAVVESPEALVSELVPAVGGSVDRAAWNRTERPFPVVPLGARFAAVARAAPEACALIAGDRRLTYAELDEWSSRLARELRAAGVGPEAVVALWCERSLELVVAMVAVARAGGAYLALDPELPAERARFMLVDAGARAVVVAPELAARLPGPLAIPVVSLGGAGDADPGDAPAPDAHPDGLAAVFYTSGTTGRPKAVGVTHRGICRLVLESPELDVAPSDRVAHLASPSFDAATFEIWGALLNGAAAVVLDRDTVLDPLRFTRALRDHEVSVMFVTTALFNETVRQVPGAFAGLRHLLFGGEAADARRARDALAQGAPARLVNVYGPTEATTFSTLHVISEIAEDATTVPIGLPIANTTAYVVDDELRPVPVGTVGELCVGGPGVARGYLGHPAATAAAFVPDPFGAPGGRLYRTGDRVARAPDGALAFVGRRDHQIKLRGYRIELGEIEAAIASYPGVAAAVAAHVVRGAASGVAGYFVGAAVDAAALRAHLAAKLPTYAVPAWLIALPALPLTGNGKVDRARLPEPGAAPRGLRASSELGGEIAAIAIIWAKVLGVEEIDPGRTFFELGGHSLLVSRVLSRVASELGATVSFREFFERPTIDGLAGVVAARRAGHGARGIAPLAPRRRS